MKKRRAPRWLRAIVPVVSAGMESTEPMAPLGYSYRQSRNCWMLCIYPRINELIGGSQDGRLVIPGFVLRLDKILPLFDKLPLIEWESPTDYVGDFDGPCLILDGDVSGRAVSLMIFDRPPPTAKIGMLVDWQKGEVRRCKRPG